MMLDIGCGENSKKGDIGLEKNEIYGYRGGCPYAAFQR